MAGDPSGNLRWSLLCKPIETVKNSVGAGDSMVAGFTVSLSNQKTIEAFKWEWHVEQQRHSRMI